MQNIPTVSTAELEERRRELVERRQLLEARYKYREATAAEFGAVHKKSLLRLRDQFATQSKVASSRNAEVLNVLNEINEQFHKKTEWDASGRHLKDQMTLFFNKAEQLFPAWRDEQLRKDAAELHMLEGETLKSTLRRQAAKEAFETQQAVREALERKKRDLAVAQMREHTDDARLRHHRQAVDAQFKEMDRAVYAEAARASQLASANATVTQQEQYPTPPKPPTASELSEKKQDPPPTSQHHAPEPQPRQENIAPGSTKINNSKHMNISSLGSSLDVVHARVDADLEPAGGGKTFDFLDAVNERTALDESVRIHTELLMKQQAKPSSLAHIDTQQRKPIEPQEFIRMSPSAYSGDGGVAGGLSRPGSRRTIRQQSVERDRNSSGVYIEGSTHSPLGQTTRKLSGRMNRHRDSFDELALLDDFEMPDTTSTGYVSGPLNSPPRNSTAQPQSSIPQTANQAPVSAEIITASTAIPIHQDPISTILSGKTTADCGKVMPYIATGIETWVARHANASCYQSVTVLDTALRSSAASMLESKFRDMGIDGQSIISDSSEANIYCVAMLVLLSHCSHEVLPESLLNGLVTLEKVRKHHNKGSARGAVDMFERLCVHVSAITSGSGGTHTATINALASALVPSGLDSDDQERCKRKITSLLQLMVTTEGRSTQSTSDTSTSQRRPSAASKKTVLPGALGGGLGTSLLAEDDLSLYGQGGGMGGGRGNRDDDEFDF